MDSSRPNRIQGRRYSTSSSSSQEPPPPQGGHSNRPWQPEEEYVRAMRRQHVSSSTAQQQQQLQQQQQQTSSTSSRRAAAAAAAPAPADRSTVATPSPNNLLERPDSSDSSSYARYLQKQQQQQQRQQSDGSAQSQQSQDRTQQAQRQRTSDNPYAPTTTATTATTTNASVSDTLRQQQQQRRLSTPAVVALSAASASSSSASSASRPSQSGMCASPPKERMPSWSANHPHSAAPTATTTTEASRRSSRESNAASSYSSPLRSTQSRLVGTKPTVVGHHHQQRSITTAAALDHHPATATSTSTTRRESYTTTTTRRPVPIATTLAADHRAVSEGSVVATQRIATMMEDGSYLRKSLLSVGKTDFSKRSLLVSEGGTTDGSRRSLLSEGGTSESRQSSIVEGTNDSRRSSKVEGTTDSRRSSGMLDGTADSRRSSAVLDGADSRRSSKVEGTTDSRRSSAVLDGADSRRLSKALVADSTNSRRSSQVLDAGGDGTRTRSSHSELRRSSHKTASNRASTAVAEEVSGERSQSSRQLRAQRLRHEQQSRHEPEVTTTASKMHQSMGSLHYTPTPISPTPKPQASSTRRAQSLAEQSAAKREALAHHMASAHQNKQQQQQHQQQQPKDEVAQTHDSAVKGWSTLSSSRRASLTEAAKTRRVSDSAVPTTTAAHNDDSVNQFLAQRKKEASSDSSGGVRVSSYEEESDSESSLDDTESDDEMSAVDQVTAGDGAEWSVRVCIVSAVDLPATVVPNLPLSPVLRVGLVHLPPPPGGAAALKQMTNAQQQQSLQSAMAETGLRTMTSARVRSTAAKILSSRDNGSVEFHEDMRWDHVRNPETMALAVELSSRAVMTPTNVKESPPARKNEPPRVVVRTIVPAKTSPGNEGVSDSGAPGLSTFGSLFRIPSSAKKGKTEMETAHAAAAVARILVDGNEGSSSPTGGLAVDSKATTLKVVTTNQSEVDVKLRPRKRRKNAKMTEDLYIGSQIIPLKKLALQKAMSGKETARIEQWFELESGGSIGKSVTPSSSSSPPASAGTKRNPSVLLEISFSSSDVLDDSEDEMDEEDGVDTKLKASFSKRASLKIRNQLKDEAVQPKVQKTDEEPELLPGVIDYICVVGARDIGDQKSDDGSSGWVNTQPECCVLEQFPPNDDAHLANGRPTLPNKIEWFCFPEGCRLWRGTTPPNLDELNLKRFSASSPANIATTIASFDACLGCTTSFCWFVMSSNSDVYGSENVKTYGAAIRFFVPAPRGIDPTQDDFAQTFTDAKEQTFGDVPGGRKRLWVPIGICVTSSMPIVGIMEAMLLRVCEATAAKGIGSSGVLRDVSKLVQREVAHAILTYQRPIPGVVHCSIPFLKGERFRLMLPPRSGLPPLPHGSSISSVCRLLGADGVNYLLAALLTECKILIHSDDIANLCLTAEVMTALIYPFSWALPYVPVLPLEMMEVIEAPLSYLLGIPTCNLKYIDPVMLDDVVVVNLDSDCFSSEYAETQRVGARTKTPTPLPASVAASVSKTVYRLLRVEEEAEDSVVANPLGARSFPRMEPESTAEREFRVAVALEVCSLLRGYQDCLVYASSSQPVFNVDRFLQIAPALFEEQRGTALHQGQELVSQFVLSPRSRRFMSLLVNCQHFHQLLDCLDSDHVAFFHEAMSTVSTNNVTRRAAKRPGHILSLDFHKTMESLCSFLQKLDDQVPTYRVQRITDLVDKDDEEYVWGPEETTRGARFPRDLLQQISLSSETLESSGVSEQGEGVRHVSLDYLVELEKNPWRYQCLFDADIRDAAGRPIISISEKVKLRDAIGERRYRAWKLAIEQDKFDLDEMSVMSDDDGKRVLSFDLKSVLTATTADVASVSSDSASGSESKQGISVTPSQRRVADAKDRDIVRRCLEKALTRGKETNETVDKGRDLLSESEMALRNPTARKFLLSVLSQRSVAQNEPAQLQKDRRRTSTGASKLESQAFDTLLRLVCAALDACMEAEDYETAYSLLKLTAGIYTISGETDNDVAVSYMTSRMGLHPIYADPGVWEKATDLHLSARRESKIVEREEKNGEVHDDEDDDYEAAVATLYEMLGYSIPAEELARFAARAGERRGWFQSERGHSLMLLARRLAVRREQSAVASPPSKKSDIELINPTQHGQESAGQGVASIAPKTARGAAASDMECTWVELGWCHPASQSVRRHASTEKSRRPGTQSLLNMLDEQKVVPDLGGSNLKHMKRSSVTSVAYLGSSVVISGGLDGGVFMARRVQSPSNETVVDGFDTSGVQGVHLDWGSSGSRFAVGSPSNSQDGEYGAGAVTCLACTRGTLPSSSALTPNGKPTSKDIAEPLVEEDLLAAMEGCRVIAGTTCGFLRVWWIKDVFSAVFYSHADSVLTEHKDTHRGPEGASSKFVSGKRKATTDFAAGSSLTRLKFSLRGRALSGHRGGVSCVDVPSNVYRPDSVITGGADGLIKLWSLRSPGAVAGRRNDQEQASGIRNASMDPHSPRSKAVQNGDALSILSGHGGRVLCVKTAWHGDRLLSGGADRTVRVWDIGGGGGRCLNSLTGHLGWVSHVQYWGPNTIISASTDRSIALWDARVRSTPLFSLRHHYAPISDLLVGARTDPIMVSAASDGTIAAWDFRHLSGQERTGGSDKKRFCQIVREPPGRLYLQDYRKKRYLSGPVELSRGPSLRRKTVMCVGGDAIIREWDYQTGEVIAEHITGHCDLISSFESLQGDRFCDNQLETSDPVTGTITASWDGTVRMRTLVRK